MVLLEVSTELSSNVLRWAHNGVPVSDWDGMGVVSITDVRKADEGIYECYEEGHRENGLHAIMRLIVRGKIFISSEI